MVGPKLIGHLVNVQVNVVAHGGLDLSMPHQLLQDGRGNPLGPPGCESPPQVMGAGRLAVHRVDDTARLLADLGNQLARRNASSGGFGTFPAAFNLKTRPSRSASGVCKRNSAKSGVMGNNSSCPLFWAVSLDPEPGPPAGQVNGKGANQIPRQG